ncbi:hypothetical protein FEM33_17190 [Dyadobacter flavalbus]|uniref:Uncharacterized protein n=1 Tax=Dyadobacter flavalbus TaxID=2579942 RepID=A0A5M8QWN5_9BACT|nr:hypothetical protein [Dyadobacter flavalbus]KAA6438422.1 hypothetical protein FEM33_17190 [Dyadobacter flavalbus]
MIRYFLFFTFGLALLSCREDKISTTASDCYSGFKGLRRGQYIVDAPVIVQMSGGLAAGSQLVASNGVSWGGCHLPEPFLQDSLPIFVTGYFLTSDDLEGMNLIPLPFEVTSVKRR